MQFDFHRMNFDNMNLTPQRFGEMNNNADAEDDDVKVERILVISDGSERTLRSIMKCNIKREKRVRFLIQSQNFEFADSERILGPRFDDEEARIRVKKERHHVCHLCDDVRFESPEDLASHVAKAHDPDSVRERKEAELIPCPKCEFAFPDQTILETHMKRRHIREDRAKPPKRKKSRFSCEIRKKDAKCDPDNGNDEEFVVEEDEKESFVKEKPGQKRKILECLHCDFNTGNSQVLAIHSYNEHNVKMPDLPPKQTCSLCDLETFDIKKHMIKTHEITSFNESESKEKASNEGKCSLCDYSGENTNELAIHAYKKHGINSISALPQQKHECKVCGFKNSMKFKVINHVKKVHAAMRTEIESNVWWKKHVNSPMTTFDSAKKRHECEHCHQSYAKPGLLAIHAFNIHGVKLPHLPPLHECNICHSKSFCINSHFKYKHEKEIPPGKTWRDFTTEIHVECTPAVEDEDGKVEEKTVDLSFTADDEDEVKEGDFADLCEEVNEIKNEVLNDDEEEEVEKSTPKKYKYGCDDCDYSSPRESVLAIHAFNRHGVKLASLPPMQKCKICPDFKTYYFREHIKFKHSELYVRGPDGSWLWKQYVEDVAIEFESDQDDNLEEIENDQLEETELKSEVTVEDWDNDREKEAEDGCIEIEETEDAKEEGGDESNELKGTKEKDDDDDDSNEEEEKESESNPTQGSSGGQFCSECKYSCKQKRQMLNHCYSKHKIILPGGTLLRCEMEDCNFETVNSTYLKQHEREIHRKEKRFQCELCDYATYSKSCFVKHESSVHSNVRDTPCECCSFRAKNIGHLYRHMKTQHADSKKYSCEKCGEHFYFVQQKERHEKRCLRDKTDI